jgi:2-hydroxy-3-keto-5-methylthiopentenyl-1-phosphate phosphatase
MKKAAILYDFDKTLCTKDMQEYSLIPSLGYESPGVFWDEVTELCARYRMDSISAYLYHLQKKFAEQGNPLRKDMFRQPGHEIELYPGVKTWFRRINDYGRRHGLLIEHYIISSGMAEIIENSEIADEFKKIYACRYYYEDGVAVWPAQVVNYTTKTQYIFRINKQVLDENDDASLNEYVAPSRRPVPFTRMVYVADGLTDVPCMRLVKEYGGKSIAVYNEASQKAVKTAKKLINDGRANYMVKADYREDSDMEKLVKRIIDHMSADSALEDLEGIYR